MLLRVYLEEGHVILTPPPLIPSSVYSEAGAAGGPQKWFSENFHKTHWKTLVPESSLNKVAGLTPTKKRLRQRYVNLVIILTLAAPGFFGLVSCCK